jgi:hypothetical protein
MWPPERYATTAGRPSFPAFTKELRGDISPPGRPISKTRQGGLAFNGIGAIGAVVARFVHTEEVTGSNPVSPTNEWPVPLNQRNGPFRFSGCDRPGPQSCQPFMKECLHD